MKTLVLSLIAFIATFVLVSCQQAARNVVYSAYEKVGVQKRDILKKRVASAKDEQKEAGESFKNALEELQALYGYDGGNLERQYKSLKNSYDKASDQAANVHASIDRMETVASDLFKEWETEIGAIQTASLQTRSRQELRETKARFTDLDNALKASEKRMKPVLTKLNDHVLFLKHNLNAQAIGSLKTQANGIQAEIERLITDMNTSVAQADQFIQQLP